MGMVHRPHSKRHKAALQRYTERHLKGGTIDKKDVLTVDDWIQLERASIFLDAFKGATLEMQGNKPTLANVLENMDILEAHMKDCLVCRTISILLRFPANCLSRLIPISKLLDHESSGL
jgi:hypothetical protein